MKTQKSALRNIKAGLYVVATPIGNLSDITERAKETLQNADVIACEDTRMTGKLLSRFGIKTPMLAYHDHNADKIRPQIIARIEKGEAVALVSDAGTPLISDPGCKLVADCAEKELYVSPLPGACAAISALSVAGLPSDRFLFEGFLPNKDKAKREALIKLKDIPATLIFYESPNRLYDTLFAMSEVLGARKAVVARELTKIYEELVRGTLPELAQRYENAEVKGEIVLLVAPPAADEAENSALDAEAVIAERLKAGDSVKEAAEAASTLCGVKRKEAYKIALALKDANA